MHFLLQPKNIVNMSAVTSPFYSEVVSLSKSLFIGPFNPADPSPKARHRIMVKQNLVQINYRIHFKKN